MRGALLRAAALVLLAIAAGCARPTGDFGRPRETFTHDEAMPTLGAMRADAAGEQVSKLNFTDVEREMHDRIWRFLVAPHALDPELNKSAELQRTRLSGPRDWAFSPGRYYGWLRTAKYRSSATRYATVSADIEADFLTLPAAFAAVCAVIEVDRQRALAAAATPAAPLDDVKGRQAENLAAISWFVRALHYRSESYQFALDLLLVETPHETAREVNARLERLAPYVAAAQAGAFCTDARRHAHPVEEPLPSRYAVAGEAAEVRIRK